MIRTDPYNGNRSLVFQTPAGEVVYPESDANVIDVMDARDRTLFTLRWDGATYVRGRGWKAGEAGPDALPPDPDPEEIP